MRSSFRLDIRSRLTKFELRVNCLRDGNEQKVGGNGVGADEWRVRWVRWVGKLGQSHDEAKEKIMIKYFCSIGPLRLSLLFFYVQEDFPRSTGFFLSFPSPALELVPLGELLGRAEDALARFGIIAWLERVNDVLSP